MTLLEELNTLLAKSDLKIPSHFKEVHFSGKNLKWLRKNFINKEETPERIKELLRMNINELTRG